MASKEKILPEQSALEQMLSKILQNTLPDMHPCKKAVKVNNRLLNRTLDYLHFMSLPRDVKILSKDCSVTKLVLFKTIVRLSLF